LLNADAVEGFTQTSLACIPVLLKIRSVLMQARNL